jgi:hypothetical protein
MKPRSGATDHLKYPGLEFSESTGHIMTYTGVRIILPPVPVRQYRKDLTLKVPREAVQPRELAGSQ